MPGKGGGGGRREERRGNRGIEPRQTESKCVYPRDILQTEIQRAGNFGGVSLRERFPLASRETA